MVFLFHIVSIERPMEIWRMLDLKMYDDSEEETYQICMICLKEEYTTPSQAVYQSSASSMNILLIFALVNYIMNTEQVS